MITLKQFRDLCNKFRSAGFTVEIELYSGYKNGKIFEYKRYMFAKITGHGIIGAFSNAPADVAHYITLADGRFTADNAKVFEKWSRCPLCVELPFKFELLLQHLKLLASDAGSQISSSYSFVNNNPFPYNPYIA